LDVAFLLTQADEVASLAANLKGQLAEAQTIAPLTLARLTLGVNDVIEHLERILAEVDEATAPSSDEPDRPEEAP